MIDYMLGPLKDGHSWRVWFSKSCDQLTAADLTVVIRNLEIQREWISDWESEKEAERAFGQGNPIPALDG